MGDSEREQSIRDLASAIERLGNQTSGQIERLVNQISSQLERAASASATRNDKVAGQIVELIAVLHANAEAAREERHRNSVTLQAICDRLADLERDLVVDDAIGKLGQDIREVTGRFKKVLPATPIEGVKIQDLKVKQVVGAFKGAWPILRWFAHAILIPVGYITGAWLKHLLK